jgi:hypothetical protein
MYAKVINVLSYFLLNIFYFFIFRFKIHLHLTWWSVRRLESICIFLWQKVTSSQIRWPHEWTGCSSYSRIAHKGNNRRNNSKNWMKRQQTQTFTAVLDRFWTNWALKEKYAGILVRGKYSHTGTKVIQCLIIGDFWPILSPKPEAKLRLFPQSCF